MSETKYKKCLSVFKEASVALSSYFENKIIRLVAMVVFAVLLIIFPFVSSRFTQEIMTNVFFYIVVCLGLNIIVGFAGLLHIGYAAFIAIGAYTTGILSSTYGVDFWLTLPISLVAAVIAGLAIGIPTLPLRGDYLAIVTLGFGEIARYTARNLGITGGAVGLVGIGRPTFFGLALNKIHHFYFLYFILAILAVLISYRLYDSRMGRAWRYIREDEDAAAAMGINVVASRLSAFIIGSCFAALAGSLFAAKMTTISPESFTFLHSVMFLLAVVLGGMGKIPGVVLGAIIVVIFPEISRDIGQYRMIIFAVILLLLMLFRPQGIWPEQQNNPLKR